MFISILLSLAITPIIGVDHANFIIESFNDKCLDDSARFSSCNNAINQRWGYNIDTKAIYNLFNHKCLDVSGGEVHTNGAAVIMYDCHENTNQQWDSYAMSGQIVNLGGGKCFDINANDYQTNKNGAAVAIYDCHQGDNQKFDLPDVSSNKNEWIDTTWEQNPFMARLKMFHGPESSVCGGSIISLDADQGNGVILTAAHCVDGKDKVEVYIGCTKSLVNDGGIKYDASHWYVHPNYAGQVQDSTFVNNDIALVYLKAPITKSGAQPIELVRNMNEVQNNDPIKALGYYGICSYGALCVGGSDTDTLEYTEVHFMPENECYAKFEPLGGDAKYQVIGNEDFCVFDDIADQKGEFSSVCNGDSGSPWLFQGKQIGLASWVQYLCDPNYPSVGTSVPTYYDWIQEYKHGYITYWIHNELGNGWYTLEAKITYTDQYGNSIEWGTYYATAGFNVTFKIPKTATKIYVNAKAQLGNTIFEKYYANTDQLMKCNGFNVWGVTWYPDYANKVEGEKGCNDQ